jgi:hypothetical protein
MNVRMEKLSLETRLIVRSIVGLDKSLLISIKKGDLKDFGVKKDRSMSIEFYHIRDD